MSSPKNLLKSITSSLSWYSGLTNQLFSVARLRVFTDIFGYITCNILQLMVFILPIKVVLILGSDHLPGYMSRIPVKLSKNDWILYLAIAIVFSYLSHLLVQSYLNYSSRIYTFKFIKTNKKGNWANEDLINNIYTRFVQGKANLFIATIFILALSIVYDDLLLTVFVSISVAFLLSLYFLTYSERFKHYFYSNPPKLLQFFSVPIFLIVFTYIIFDFLFNEEPPHILSAIIGLVLSRQLVNVLSQFIINQFWFRKKKLTIQKLFFKGYLDFVAHSKDPYSIWSLLNYQNIDETFISILEKTFDSEVRVKEYFWVKCPIPFVYLFDIHLENVDPKASSRVILKIFDHNKKKLAHREMVLYEQLQDKGIIPDVLACIVFNTFHIHLFNIDSNTKITYDQADTKHLLSNILTVKVDDDFFQQYSSEHAFIWERLTPDLFNRLHLLGYDDVTYLISFFDKFLPEILSKIQKLPLALSIPLNLFSGPIITDNKKHLLLVLGNWQIEPICCSIPSNDANRKLWQESISQLAAHDDFPELNELAIIGNSLIQLEDSLTKGRLIDALELSILIRDTYKNMCSGSGPVYLSNKPVITVKV